MRISNKSLIFIRIRIVSLASASARSLLSVGDHPKPNEECVAQSHPNNKRKYSPIPFTISFWIYVRMACAFCYGIKQFFPFSSLFNLRTMKLEWIFFISILLCVISAMEHGKRPNEITDCFVSTASIWYDPTYGAGAWARMALTIADARVNHVEII